VKLYVIRHGKAIQRGTISRDEERWLMPDGRAAFRATARLLAERKLELDLIVTSPLIRAVQTADILAEALKYEGDLLVSPELSPGFSREGLLRLVTESSSARRLAIVGHEPDLGDVTASLFSLNGSLTLKKGMVVAMEWDPAAPGTAARFLWAAHKGRLVDAIDAVTGG